MKLKEVNTIAINNYGESALEPKPFQRLQLHPVSRQKLFNELENDSISPMRKNAILNALLFAHKLTEETKGLYPSWIGMPNPGGSVPYWFSENKETGLIHVQTDFTWYCYHPGYIFDEPTFEGLTSHAKKYHPSQRPQL